MGVLKSLILTLFLAANLVAATVSGEVDRISGLISNQVSNVTNEVQNVSGRVIDNSTRDSSVNFWADEVDQPKLTSYSESTPMLCPKVADEKRYFTRFLDIDLDGGKVTCALYAKTDPEKVLSIKSLKYDAIDKYYNNSGTDYDKIQITFNTDSYKNLNSRLESIKEEVFAQYSNGTKEFLPMSTYYTALFSMNGNIIDIPKTIEENRVTTKSQYTIYPDEVGVTYTFKESIMNGINAAWNFVTGKDDNEKEYDRLEHLEYTSMTAKTQSVHSSSIVVFFAKLAPLFNDMSTILLFLLGGYGIGAGSFSAFTKHLSKISNFDNYMEKIAVGAGVLVMMFTTPINYESSSNKDVSINQSRALALFQGAYQYSDEWARKATNALIDTQVSELAKRAGIYAPETIKRNTARAKKIQNQLVPVNNALLEVCKATYSVPALKKDFGEKIFPTYELRTKKGAMAYSEWGYVQPGMSDPSATRLGSMITLTGCGKIMDRALRYKQELKDINTLINNAQRALNSTDMFNKVDALARMQYQVSAEYGWFAIAIIPSTKAMVDIMNMFGDEQSMEDKNEAAADEIAKRSPEDGWLTEENLVHASGIVPLAIIKDLPYMAAPGFSDIYNMLKLDNDGMVLGALKKIPLVGEITKGVVGAGANIIIFVITVFLYKIMLTYMVLLTLTLITSLSILFWLIKLLVFIFSIPFAVAFGFMGSNKERVFGFAGKGIELMFTPFLIIMSVFLAMYSNYFIGDFTPTIIAQQMSTLTDVSAMGTADAGFWNGVITDTANHFFRIILFDMYNSMLLLGANIVSLAVVAILAFGGPSFITRLLGIGSMEDLGSNLGERLVGKQTRFTEV